MYNYSITIFLRCLWRFVWGGEREQYVITKDGQVEGVEVKGR
jgi:hypothetical protein